MSGPDQVSTFSILVSFSKTAIDKKIFKKI